MECSECGDEIEECSYCGQFFEKGNEIICDGEEGHYCDSECYVDCQGGIFEAEVV